jgi:hypothetical protein
VTQNLLGTDAMSSLRNIKKIELYRTDEDGGFEIDSDGEEE